MRRDALVARPGKDGKVWFLKVGSTWMNEQGKETLYLDCIPLADKDGRVVIHLREPLPKNGQQPAPQSRPIGGMSSRAEMDDEIPF